MEADIKYKILVYDPIFHIGKELIKHLGGVDFSIRICEKTEALPRSIREFSPQLVAIFIRSESDFSLKLISDLTQKKNASSLSILAIIEHADELLEIAAFNAGADSVIWPPLAPRALKMRLQALIQRTILQKETNTILKIGPLLLDNKLHSAYWNGNTLSLGRREFDLLLILCKNPGKLFTRNELLEMIVGNDTQHSPRTIDVHICNLREKLGEPVIGTFKGKGYQLNVTALMQLAQKA